jgi:hypothetical protein
MNTMNATTGSVAVRSDLLSRPQAAEYLGVRPQTLAAWQCTGRYNLPLIHVGRLVKYRQSDLERWLLERTSNNGSSDGAAGAAANEGDGRGDESAAS